MKYFGTVLSALILLSCSKQKEQLEKIVFDTRQINSKISYVHSFYPSGKIKTTKRVEYYYKNGSLIDSLAYTKKFFYNSKDQIIRVEENDENEYRFYNNIDSLIAKYSINEFGDTTLLNKIQYSKGKISNRSYRRLMINFKEDLSKTDLRNYDTIFDETQYRYAGDSLEIQIFKDKKGVTGETYLHYEKKNKSKAINYNFLGNQKYVQHITYFDQSYSEDPDYVDINPSGDTVGFKKTFFEDSVRIEGTYMAAADTQTYSFYNAQNQLTKWVINDLYNQRSNIFTYSYDSKGNLIEETSVTERIVKNFE